MAEPLGYNPPPLDAAAPLATRDGRVVRARHMRANDGPLLERMFYRLSSETRWRRFFVPLDSIDQERVQSEAKRLALLDPHREVALVAIYDEHGHDEIVAVARYGRLDDADNSAEGSIVVRDDFQGVGLGAQLFDLLIQVSLARGIQHMVLLTHADNRGMIGLVRHLGLPYSGKYAAGLYEIDLRLTDGTQPIFPFSRPQP